MKIKYFISIALNESRVFCKYEFVFSVSPCDSVTCQNEGTCVVEAGLAICYCRGDYSGATCAGEYYIRPKNL
jgi:hypothetical protein